jgi:exosortase
MAKQSVSAVTPELQLPEPTWTPARIGLGLTRRDAGFLLLVALSVAWCWQPLTTVIGRSLKSGEYEHYSHIILLPFFSAYLLYLNRHTIFRHVHSGLLTGSLLAAGGAASIWLAETTLITRGPETLLSLTMLGLVTVWAGGFVLCYGLRAFRAAAFPFLLLVFMVPLPPLVLDTIIVFLQRTSAEASAWLFTLIGMPNLRDGLVFALPGITIEVARECSGIRSSIALLISGLTAAHLFLHSTWSKATLALMIIPIAIVKNAVRIVLLSWLAVNVDPSFITGSSVHRNSGIPVFFTSLALLAAAVWVLRKFEQRSHT